MLSAFQSWQVTVFGSAQAQIFEVPHSHENNEKHHVTSENRPDLEAPMGSSGREKLEEPTSLVPESVCHLHPGSHTVVGKDRGGQEPRTPSHVEMTPKGGARSALTLLQRRLPWSRTKPEGRKGRGTVLGNRGSRPARALVDLCLGKAEARRAQEPSAVSSVGMGWF